MAQLPRLIMKTLMALILKHQRVIGRQENSILAGGAIITKGFTGKPDRLILLQLIPVLSAIIQLEAGSI